MRMASWQWGGREHVGIISPDGREATPLALADASRGVLPLIQMLMRGEPLPSPCGARLPLEVLTLRAPLPRPLRSLFCVGRNYHAHAAELATTVFSTTMPKDDPWPIVFGKLPECVIGPFDAVHLPAPAASVQIDYESELAVVIGRGGRDIARSRAMDHVFGYTIVNDVTARDRQVRTNAQGFTWYELGRGKCFDTSAPTGPCIVTADEIGDPQNLRLRTRINGELRQSASTGNMIFSCAHLIHYFSANMTLKPGMIIITGTPGGTAWSTDAELGGKWVGGDGSETLIPATGYCKPGDVIECEMEKIGVLRNQVALAG